MKVKDVKNHFFSLTIGLPIYIIRAHAKG